ncbi:hypothetical protein BH24CHL4_BH24CHL4_08990 [soil metagenome]
MATQQFRAPSCDWPKYSYYASTNVASSTVVACATGRHDAID